MSGINIDTTIPTNSILPNILDETKTTDVFFRAKDINMVIDLETERLKQKQTGIETAMQSQMRLVDLETSYTKKYTEYIHIIATIVISVFLIISVKLIGMNYTILSPAIVSMLIAIIFIGAVIIVYMKYIDMYSREILNYDKLQLQTPQEMSESSTNNANGQGAFANVPKLSLQGIENTLVNEINYLSGNLPKGNAFSSTNNCIGQDCCDGNSTWCERVKGCVYSPDKNINVCDTAGLSDNVAPVCPIMNGSSKKIPSASASPSTIGSSKY
jgi:hypothetical protein